MTRRTFLEPASRRPIPVLQWHDIDVGEDPPALVAGFLPRHALAVIFGESGCGKSFLASDLALHVAHGWTWHAHEVATAGAIYVAAEGASSLRKRIVAFRQANNVDLDAGTPFALVPTSLDLCGNDDVRPLIDAIHSASADWHVPVGLIIIDTLSRVLAGGDENSPSDMGALVWNLEQLRAETGACLVVVHHSGKDASRGARGHSLLRAALDTEISVQRDSVSKIATATVTKQRDGEEGQSFSFELESVSLENGSTSCIVAEATPPLTTQNSNTRRMAPGPTNALLALHNAMAKGAQRIPVSPDTPPSAVGITEKAWRDQCAIGWLRDKKPDTAAKAFDRAGDELQARGIVGRAHGWVWPVGQLQTKPDMS